MRALTGSTCRTTGWKVFSPRTAIPRHWKSLEVSTRKSKPSCEKRRSERPTEHQPTGKKRDLTMPTGIDRCLKPLVRVGWMSLVLLGCNAGPDYAPPTPEPGDSFEQGGPTFNAQKEPASQWWL